ncbi:Mss4-like protein [Ascosphaera apis ARSEF 7405]|uniref:Mss4-like protein n=1 Tax=Ascosphaera apis ARSEF 7405 TaxID=392613 RepID=A0A166NCA1_9EURO|nr:Mss4-like protein [Ascosphaera apis ARSEF 7405]
MTKHHGRCHCGQVDYDVDIPDQENHILCHCSACKYMSGGEYTVNHYIPSKNLHINKGDLSTYTYLGDSGQPVHCHFCTNCASPIYNHPESAGQNYVLRTSSVDHAFDWPVVAEVEAAHRAKWQPDVAPSDHIYEAEPPA